MPMPLDYTGKTCLAFQFCYGTDTREVISRVTLALRFPSRFKLLGLHRIAPDGDCIVPVMNPADVENLH